MIVYFGKDVPSFNEIVKVYSFRDKAHFDSINWEVEGLIFSEQPVIDEGQGVYLKEYYMLDTVDDVPVKYKIPKIIGRGNLGVHFHDLDGGNMMTIQSKSEIGDTLTQYEIFKSFKSIEFN